MRPMINSARPVSAPMSKRMINANKAANMIATIAAMTFIALTEFDLGIRTGCGAGRGLWLSWLMRAKLLKISAQYIQNRHQRLHSNSLSPASPTSGLVRIQESRRHANFLRKLNGQIATVVWLNSTCKAVPVRLCYAPLARHLRITQRHTKIECLDDYSLSYH